jgi:hypothetical protein
VQTDVMSYNLQQRLDAFVSGECSPGAFVQELSVLCDATPDSAWDVLSLVDRYYRRGKLPADLFRTVKYRIERQALGVRDSDTTREFPPATVASGAAVGAMRGVGVVTQERAPGPKELANEARALRIELLNARQTMQRYRKRLAILAGFGHRTRCALVTTQRELQRYRKRVTTLAEFGRRTRSALANAQRELGVSRSQSMDFSERLRSSEWRRSLHEHISDKFTESSSGCDRARIWRPIRSSRAVALAAVLLGVGASPALQDFPGHWEARNIAPPPAAAVVLAQIAAPGQINLSTDKYVVFPGRASAEIQVHRSGGASGDVSFVWWTRGSGAAPGLDYVSQTRKIAHMADGVDTLLLKVPILANPSRKHTELFYAVIAHPGGGASLGSIRRAAVFIMRPD